MMLLCERLMFDANLSRLHESMVRYLVREVLASALARYMKNLGVYVNDLLHNGRYEGIPLRRRKSTTRQALA